MLHFDHFRPGFTLQEALEILFDDAPEPNDEDSGDDNDGKVAIILIFPKISYLLQQKYLGPDDNFLDSTVLPSTSRLQSCMRPSNNTNDVWKSASENNLITPNSKT